MSDDIGNESLENLSYEDRTFAPSASFAQNANVKNVLVVKRTGQAVYWSEKDIWWHDLVDKQADTHTPEFFDSENGLLVAN